MNKNLGIIDSEKAGLLAAEEAPRKQANFESEVQQRNTESLSSKLPQNAHRVDADKQLGRGMSVEEFELRLTKLNPRLKFIVMPLKKSKKAIYTLGPDGGATFILAYENGFMPERSIHEEVIELVPDYSIGMPGTPAIQRADVEKQATWIPSANAPLGGEYHFEDKTAGLGWKKITRLGAEKTRGWRTVLIKLMISGYLTLGQIEREFGADNTAEWQGHTGKASIVTPW